MRGVGWRVQMLTMIECAVRNILVDECIRCASTESQSPCFKADSPCYDPGMLGALALCHSMAGSRYHVTLQDPAMISEYWPCKRGREGLRIAIGIGGKV